MSECCSGDCNQGRDCPARCMTSIVRSLLGYAVVLIFSLAAAAWLAVSAAS